jgi:hypothetical protein
VRQSLDGARLTLAWREWNVDVLALRRSETNRGIFANSLGHGQSLWGVYATRGGRRTVDIYYLGLDRKIHEFDVSAHREQRQSIGGRMAGKPGASDYDHEAVWQFGSFGPMDIWAWTIASNSG